MSTLAPERMQRDQLIAEVGELLAVGVARILARECDVAKNSPDQLDVLGDVEAPCVETTEPTE